MTPIMRALLACVVSLVRSRAALHLGILALRHQLGGVSTIDPTAARAAERSNSLVVAGAGLGPITRGLDVCTAGNRARLAAPAVSRPLGSPQPTGPGPVLAPAIREISAANPRWGSPRILGA